MKPCITNDIIHKHEAMHTNYFIHKKSNHAMHSKNVCMKNEAMHKACSCAENANAPKNNICIKTCRHASLANVCHNCLSCIILVL